MKNSKIIGYSGIDGMLDIKRRYFPNLTDRESAFVQGADSAAALLIDGEVVAAASEERFTGEKHTGRFPVNAIRWCLDQADIEASDIDTIAHGFDYTEFGEWSSGERYYSEIFTQCLSPAAQVRKIASALGEDIASRLVSINHHRAHAAYALHGSGFDSAIVYVSDGLGESESATVYAAKNGCLEPVHRTSALHSIGVLYGLVTHYLGFWFGSDEYKVMGLAPYGDAGRYERSFMDRFVKLLPQGRYSVPILSVNTTLAERETYSASLRLLVDELGPVRAASAPVEQRHIDIAAALQRTIETVLLHVLGHHRAALGIENLCMAGGTALNCVANGKILRSGCFKNIYVAPAAGDDGVAIGAAIAAFEGNGGVRRPVRLGPPLLGHRLQNSEIDEAIAHPDVLADVYESEDLLVDAVTNLLQDGMVVGWAQGSMEFGPRALGCRSIIADPRRVEMRDKINSLVKKREVFRPFAPAVTEENASRFFDIPTGQEKQFDSMLFTVQVRSEYVARLPAITHVDGSARLQTVSRENNGLFWALLRSFGEKTGIPVLLNTSFNVNKQPIVRTGAEAVETFLAAGLDALVIGKAVLRRKPLSISVGSARG